MLVGYGRVGTAIAERLLRDGVPFVIIEVEEDRIRAARKSGISVIEGNAATGQALQLANIGAATTLFVAIPNAFEAGETIEQARRANGRLVIIARAHSDEEAQYLRQVGADHVLMGEREIGLGMLNLRNGRESS